jgi:tetratricopeptide (TPR) repeat protein
MANSARTQPGVETERVIETKDTESLENVQVFYEKNKKPITGIALIVVGIVVAYFGYTKLYKGPAEEKAAAALFYPEQYFAADSLNMALNGDGKNPGFIKVASKFSGTAAANLSKYYMGLCYLKMDDFGNATKALEGFDGKGTMVAYQAWGALGDAYMGSGNAAKAIDYYKKATEDKDNVLITPQYLYKLGLAYAATGKTNEAKDAFKRIRDEYPRSTQSRDIDKELARMGELN